MKLTQRRIETHECPAGSKDALAFDDEQRGLGVRITSGGGKSYVAQYTFAGSKRRVPLGSCSAISLAAAREAVRTILGDAARGVDTAAERKAKLKAAADAVRSLSRSTCGTNFIFPLGGRTTRRRDKRSPARLRATSGPGSPSPSTARQSFVSSTDFPRMTRPRWLAHSPVMAARSMAGPFGAGRFRNPFERVPVARPSAVSGSFGRRNQADLGRN